ncbi:MAG: SRPBCC family protein [Actinobacteria bacterium]|nr:SRPBCC family protein [Actinomycetota bacterium]
MRIRGEVTINAPIDAAWAHLADIDSHVDWMADAESITFTSAARTGVGTAFECVTKVGPLRTTDKMTVTEWDDGRRIGVAHSGIVVGSGVFELAAVNERVSRLSWTEDLRFPWFVGGVVSAFAARPVLKRIWMGNLRRFKGITEGHNR